MSTVKWRLVAALATAVLIAGCTSSGGADDSAAGDQRPTLHQPSESVDDPADGEEADADSNAQEEREEGRAPDEEAEEETELTEKRVEALKDARKEGVFGRGIDIASKTTPGWTDERLLNPETDDWEPALAADPRAPYVYLLTTRYGAGKTCPGNCPTPWLALTISDDGGRTWDLQHPMCVCRGAKAQYDPTIEVVPETGDVYSAFLNADQGAFSTSFIRSSDHGQTWTKPVHVFGKVKWTDKPEITSSPDGRDVYVSWNGPTGGDLYVGVSHDFGRTWKQHRLTNSKRYYYAYDAATMPDGTVVFSESSLRYGPKDEVEGKVWHHAVISSDRGRTWENVVVDSVHVGTPCVAKGCSSDFYIGQTSVASDATGDLVFAYEGARRTGGPQRVYVTPLERRWPHVERSARAVGCQARTRPARASTSPAQARRARGTCRRRTAATPTCGTCGSGAPPTPAGLGAHRFG